MKFLPLIFLLLAPLIAGASATRTIDADALASSTHATTVSLPGATGTAMISAGIVQEKPSGNCNGSNTSFTLANTPVAGLTVSLSVSGTTLNQGSGQDFTISGATITLASACAIGQSLWAVYSKY